MVLFMVFGNQFVIMDIDARCGINILKMASSSNEPTKEYVSLESLQLKRVLVDAKDNRCFQ
jgi:hypothetical protein